MKFLDSFEVLIFYISLLNISTIGLVFLPKKYKRSDNIFYNVLYIFLLISILGFAFKILHIL